MNNQSGRTQINWPPIIMSAVIGAAVALAVVFVLPGPASITESQARHTPPQPAPDFSDAAAMVLPSVVSVSADLPEKARQDLQDWFQQRMENGRSHRDDPFSTPPPRGESSLDIPHARSMGAGWICRSDGFIVTNLHLVQDARNLQVQLFDGGDERTLPARYWAGDTVTDVAVLRVQADRKLSAIPLDSGAPVSTGEWVVAVGSPFGLERSVTAGIVSAAQRRMPGDPGGSLPELIQTDAAITTGSSGGPVVNRRGRLVGMSVAMARSDTVAGRSPGYGFVIPVSSLKSIIPQLIENRRVARAFLGCTVSGLTDNMRDFYGIDDGGALVTDVSADSPARAAGIQPDDVIVSMGNAQITAAADAYERLREHEPDDVITVRLVRDRSPLQVQVSLSEWPVDTSPEPPQPETQTSGGDMGITVKEVDRLWLSSHGLQRQQGVVVQEVKPGSSAAGVVQSGDIVLRINDEAVTDSETYEKLHRQAVDSGAGYLIMHLQRQAQQGSARRVVVDIPLPDTPQAGAAPDERPPQ
ncbi:MAG: trypsin-like peptidase domain-containing protein [Armatimonadota bacterium]